VGELGKEHHIQITEVSPYSTDQLYSLVSDIERYYEFLPWCKGSRIKGMTADDVVAELTVGYGPLQTTFTTRNRDQPGKSIQMELVEGPLEQLKGSWHFQQGKDGKTRVDLDLKFRFVDRRMDIPFGLVSKKAVKRMVKAFNERARYLYGPSGMD
jgi:ribosome-associated toxin RatA of RatAB toxin-antitoxin module